MVSRERVGKKLAELLVDGSLTARNNYNQYVKMRRKLDKLPWHVKDRYVVDICSILERIERNLRK